MLILFSPKLTWMKAHLAFVRKQTSEDWTDINLSVMLLTNAF